MAWNIERRRAEASSLAWRVLTEAITRPETFDASALTAQAFADADIPTWQAREDLLHMAFVHAADLLIDAHSGNTAQAIQHITNLDTETQTALEELKFTDIIDQLTQEKP